LLNRQSGVGDSTAYNPANNSATNGHNKYEADSLADLKKETEAM